MSLLHAIVLGVIQGLTEFLPVSSSGHLVIVPRMLGWGEHPRAFDVALHQGTLLATLLYFRRDFIRLTVDGVHDAVRHGTHFARFSPYGRLAWLIVLGCLPAVLIGALFGSWIDAHAGRVWLVALFLVLFGVLMLIAERVRRPDVSSSSMERVDTRRSVLIGAAQAVALLPGVSRSGITIATGMFAGLSRETAARFSFLLSAPVILGAGLKDLPDIRHASEQGINGTELAAGFVVSFVVGLAAMHFLLRYVARYSLAAFTGYRVAIAALAVLVIYVV